MAREGYSSDEEKVKRGGDGAESRLRQIDQDELSGDIMKSSGGKQVRSPGCSKAVFLPLDFRTSGFYNRAAPRQIRTAVISPLKDRLPP